ncbi:hypothetical protein CDEST_01060 [Colletotrichum destructivum]|uniref:Uncharacterized protein n=1 Tax=Colletotrichum destructivum TaxID=34406 RepID=A0AAX4HYX9_9PEZI|nr:hypothetical protein CDEST_01060 [Colletotrichum destructivum]
MVNWGLFARCRVADYLGSWKAQCPRGEGCLVRHTRTLQIVGVKFARLSGRGRTVIDCQQKERLEMPFWVY